MSKKSRKSKYNGKDSKKDWKESREKKRTDNDITWYAANEQLLMDASNLSFATQVGAPIRWLKPEVYESFPELNTTADALPGIMSINVIPGPGYSDNMSSPVNMCARNVYSFIRKANSGAKNYDPADLMMYLLAMDNLYTFHAFLTRIYGVARTYSAINRYYPYAVLSAMHVNWEDVQSNLANLRYWINVFAVKIGTMAVPSTFYYFQRHAWMFSNLYADSQTSKFQTYMFNPEIIYEYRGFDSEVGGQLVPHFMRDGEYWTVSRLIELGNQLIRSVVDDPDFNVMSGDIIKAFDTNLLGVQQINDDYVTPIEFNAEVLTQIHNATAVGRPNFEDDTEDINDSHIIYVNNDIDGAPIIYKPKFAPAGRGYGLTDRLIDLPFNSPKPGDVMIATRLTVDGGTVSRDMAAEETVYPIKWVEPDAFGSEIVTTLDIYTDPLNALKSTPVQFYNFTGKYVSYAPGASPGVTTSINAEWADLMSHISKFGMHPQVVFEYQQDYYEEGTAFGESYYEIPLPFGDMDNVASVNTDVLRKMHQTAMLSLFNVPSMGAWANKSK